MVQETQAERFREHLLQALQSGIQVNSDRAWSLGWAPSEDIIFDVLTPNHLKTKFNSRSEALRQSLVKVLLAEPDSEDKVQAWRDSKKALTEISEVVATAKQREDEYTQPVFADHSDIAQRNQRRTLLQAEFASGSELEISSEILGSDLTQAETQIVGQLLTEWNQSAVLCDHVNVCTASEMAKQKRRLMLISDYRISFCRSTCKINRLPVAATIFLLDVIRIEIDDEFNIIRVIARDDDFYIFARSSSQFKVIMETLVKQFGLVLSGYPSAERVQLPSSYVLSKEPYLTAFESIKRTFEALVDRSGMMLNDFLRCVQSNFEYGKKALNLKEVIGAQPDQRALYAALLVACQALRYNCLEFEELIASYMPFGDTGMHAVSKLFTPSTVFASVDISNTSCSQKSMQILSEAIQKSSLPHLRCLNISDNPIGNAGVAMILTALRIADLRLEILACRKCGLSQKGFENLGRYLTEAKSLKVVDFSSNMPGKSGLNPLFEGFMACENIERIYLSNCGPQAKLATVLQSLVQNNPPKLKSLDVSNNRLSTQDAIQLSNLIKATDSLHELSLAHCKLRQAETNTIADAIASNQVEHLKFVLDLSRNSKHPKEESVWPLAIQTLTFPNGSGNLYALNLSDCKLTPEEFILVCEGLKSVKPLTVLSLNGSIKTGLFNKETCAKAGAAIADLMRCKQSLRMLSLSGTKNGMLGSPGINPVLEALVNNTSLYCLIISNNNLSKSSYSILRRLLRVNTTLQYLAVDYNRPALSSLWQLTGGFISSGSVCSSVPRNDFVNCIVSEKTRDVVEVLSSAIHRKFECNLRKNPMLFQSLEALIFSIPWIPRPRLCAGHLNKSDLEDFTSECALPAFYHELTQIHLYECGIPFVLTQLGDRVRSRNGLRTREIFGISELSVKYRRALNAFYNGRLELINDVQCCAHLITEYLGNRNPILSSLSCEQMNSALNVGTALLILDSELRAQERCIFFWLCDLLNDVLEMSEYNGADAHSLSILFTSCLYPMESWLENEYEKFQLTVPLFIETCIKLRSR